MTWDTLLKAVNRPVPYGHPLSFLHDVNCIAAHRYWSLVLLGTFANVALILDYITDKI